MAAVITRRHCEWLNALWTSLHSWIGWLFGNVATATTIGAPSLPPVDVGAISRVELHSVGRPLSKGRSKRTITDRSGILQGIALSLLVAQQKTRILDNDAKRNAVDSRNLPTGDGQNVAVSARACYVVISAAIQVP